MNSEYEDNPEVRDVRIAIALMEAHRDQSWEEYGRKARNWMIYGWFCVICASGSFTVLACGGSWVWAFTGSMWAWGIWFALNARKEIFGWRDDLLHKRTEAILQLKQYLKTIQ